MSYNPYLPLHTGQVRVLRPILWDIQQESNYTVVLYSNDNTDDMLESISHVNVTTIPPLIVDFFVTTNAQKYMISINTWSSCAAHSTKVTRTVREALLQQSLAGNKCYMAEERITEPDCQGEEGRAGNNR